MMNQTVVEALYSATYVEDYIDACENLPDDIQRQLSRMRELDVTCQGHIRDSERYTERLLDLLHSGSKDSEVIQREISIVAGRVQQALISTQEVGDEKLQIVQQIQDFVDNKVRQLDLDKKNLDIGKDSQEGASGRDRDRENAKQGTDRDHSHSQHERSTIIKRARRARHEVFVPSILGPSTLAATRFTSDEQKGPEARTDSGTSKSNPNTTLSISSKETPTTSATVPTVSTKVECAKASSAAAQVHSSTTNVGSASTANTHTHTQASEKVRHHCSVSSASTSIGSPISESVLQLPTTSQATTTITVRYEPKKKNLDKEVVEKKKYKKRKSKQTDSPLNIPIDPDEPTYCLCDQISYGEMIGCDNDLCPIEWFHFSCVSLSTKPKGKWYCPKCRGERPNVMKPKAIFLKELEKYNREKEEKI